MRPRLLALDLDGTLLAPDGTVREADAIAVRAALDAGVTVTIATGRVATGTLPTARVLGLESPLVCADGGLLVCGRTGDRLEQHDLALELADAVLHHFDRRALIPYVLMHDAVHCDERGRAYRAYVSIWTEHFHVHEALPTAMAWRRDGEVAMAVGIGSEEDVHATVDHVKAAIGERIDMVTFRTRNADGHSALLVRPRGCSKGAALSRLAETLGIAREDTAVVGDWFNDVSMFEWAGRSFAMGQAPEGVKRAATDTLRATSETGGGVAEAIERWLAAPRMDG